MRPILLLLRMLTGLLAASVLIVGCTVTGDAQPQGSGDRPATAGSSRDDADAPTPVVLPATPRLSGAASECAGAPVVGTHDFDHPTWGPTRLFALHAQGSGPTDACLVAMTASGVQWSHAETDYEWEFASPATDNTGNIFVVYNPGRYDGVLVLRPVAGGFAPISTDYATGPNRFYSARLVGPLAGRYDIETSANDCEPSCAGGTVTTTVLRWDGSTYS